MTTPYSGNGGTVTIGGVSLAVMQWQRQPANRKADATASDTAGWQRPWPTLKGWRGTAKVIWDYDAVPYLGGVIQNALVLMRLYYGASGKYATGYAILDGPSETVDNQTGIITYDVAWESYGAWTEQTT